MSVDIDRLIVLVHQVESRRIQEREAFGADVLVDSLSALVKAVVVRALVANIVLDRLTAMVADKFAHCEFEPLQLLLANAQR